MNIHTKITLILWTAIPCVFACSHSRAERPSELPPKVILRLSRPFDPEADRLAAAALRKIQAVEELPEFYLEYSHARSKNPYVETGANAVSLRHLIDICEDGYELMKPTSTTRFLSRLVPGENHSVRMLGFYRRSLLYNEEPPYENEEKYLWNGQEYWSTFLSFQPEEKRRTRRLWIQNNIGALSRIEKQWVMSGLIMPLAGGQRVIRHSMRKDILPSQSRYKRAGEIDLDGTRCVILDATDLCLRLLVDPKTERLVGRLTILWQGRLEAPYWTVAHDRLNVERFDSVKTFLDWASALPNDQAILVGRDCGYYMNHESGVEKNLGELAHYSDYVAIGDDVELPRKIEFARTNKVNGDRDTYNYLYSVAAMTEHHDKVDDARFADLVTPKDGYEVYDDRFDTLLQYPYDSDMSDDELRSILNEARRKKLESDEQFQKIFAQFDARIGKPAPPFVNGKWLTGSPSVRPEKPRLIHFWAVWCGPCKRDLPRLAKLSESVEVIGVHPPGTQEDAVMDLAKSYQLDYPIYLASEHEEKLVAGYPVQIFPYTVLVSPDGLVQDHGSLDDMLKRLNHPAK